MKPKLKILMLNHEYPPIGGGGGYAGRNILKQLAGRDDIEIDVITSQPQPLTTVEKFADNITLYRVGVRKKALQFWTRLEILRWMIGAYKIHKTLLRRNRYDIAHAFFGFPAAAIAWRTASELPYVISLRGSDVPGVNTRFSLDYKVLAPIFRRIWKNAAALYACSEGLRQRALKFMPSVEIDVVPNGVESDRFKPAARKRGNLRLLTVGRLSSSKRVELLISAMKLVCERYPQAKLTIAGGGRPNPALEWKRVQLGIAKQVVFLDRIPHDQIPELYRQHDIFVTATAQEGMSNAMLEAMASGLPIVTTRCEGVDELIADNGIVVEANAESIANAVMKLAGDEQMYNSMSVAALKRSRTFNWKSVADKYLELYERPRKMKYWYEEDEFGDFAGMWLLSLAAPFVIAYAWLRERIGVD